MLCRIIADTYLLTAWLIKRNDLSLFKRYKAYSVGKQKLFKLHLEEALPADNKDAERAIESLSESINEELWEELVTIDVGAPFEGMDSRKMAHETGLERVHRLVYSPYSADVHGEWTNLKVFHLQRCTNPLHRFHRLPRLTAPAMLVPQIVLDAAAMLAGTLRAWTAYYELRDAGARIDEFEDKIAGAFDIERRDDTPDQ